MKMIPFLEKLIFFIDRNKFYCYGFCGLIIWLTFIDDNDFGSTIRLQKKSAELQNEIDYYNQLITQVEQDRSEVLGSIDLQEKYAREKYFMKKADEEVFVLVDDQNKIVNK